MSTTNILDLNNRVDALEKNSGGGGGGTIPEITTITATLGTGRSPDHVKIADYPSGFNINNTAVICAQVAESDDSTVLWNGVSGYSAIWTLLLKPDGFYGIWNNNSFNNKPIKITLLKR